MGKFRFKLLAGKHAAKDEEGLQKIYKKGDVIETDSDLSKLNSGPGYMKFERLYEEGESEDEGTVKSVATPTKPQVQMAVADQPTVVKTTQPTVKTPTGPVKLESMTVEDLRSLAADEEVDLKNAKTKDEILRALRSAGVSG